MKKSKLIATLAATAVLSVGGAFAISGCNNHEHTYAEEWTKTETHHYYAPTCEHSEDKDAWKDYGEHVYDGEADADCNTCGYERTVTMLTGTVTVPGPNGGYKLEGAEVTIGGKTVRTDANGVYSVYGLTVGTGVEIQISHPACNDATGTVDVTAGSNTYNKQLAVKTIAEIKQSYFQLKEMETSDKTDFKHTQGSAMWKTAGNVQTDHGEGLCLHIDNNETKDDMESVIYQKMAITSANSKMTFRVRGFDNNQKNGLFAVRVIDIDAYSKADLKAANNEVWQTNDSKSYFINYEYDLSAYEGKTVVIMIGSKQGQHNVVERIRFVGKNEQLIMPYTTAADLTSLTASAATDLDGADAVKNAIKDKSWIKVGDQGEANEGWLFKDGTAAESGSTDLCVFTYKKLTFNGTNTIAVRARTFNGELNLPGHGRVEPQIVIKVYDANGNPVEVGGNCYTIATESYQTAYMSLGETLNGDYTFVIGIARGHRLAVDQILFKGEEMAQGNLKGTVKCGATGVEGAKISCGGFSTTTRNDGSFDLPVEIYPNSSLTVKVEKDGYVYDGAEITVSADDLANGEHSLGDIAVDKIIIGEITKSKIDSLTASAAEDLDKNKINDASWIKVGREGNHTANEGWLFRCDDRYAEEGSTDINGYVYKKLNFNGVNTIAIKARTFGGQNNVNGHGQVYPQIVIAVIDADGNLVEIGNNCYTIATEAYETAYMTLPQALTGDYTFVIGIARGRVLAVESVQFKTEAMVKGNVTGTVTDGTNPVGGATVTYAHTSVTTAADGTFTLPVEVFPGNSVTVKIQKDGYTYAGAAITVSSDDLASGSKALGSVALEKEVIKGLTQSMINGLTAANPQNIEGVDAMHKILSEYGWSKYGDIDTGHGEGTCIQVNTGNNPVSYLYKKLSITDSSKYLELSVRRFVRDSDMDGQLQVKVIKADGTVEITSLVSTDNVAADGKTLINNANDYTVGVFDLSAYVGQDVVVAIQAVDTPNAITKDQHNAINNIKFLATYNTENN